MNRFSSAFIDRILKSVGRHDPMLADRVKMKAGYTAPRLEDLAGGKKEAKSTKGNTARMPVVAEVQQEPKSTKGNTARMEIGPRMDTLPGSDRPTPTPPVGKTTVPETPAAIAKKRVKTMPGVSADAVRDEEWTKKQEEFAADAAKAEKPLEQLGYEAVTSPRKKSPESVLDPRLVPTVPQMPVQEATVPRRRGWVVNVGVVASVIVVVGAVMLTSKKDDKISTSTVTSGVPVASVMPVAMSPPPPSPTSPPVLQVAESDASGVAERHDASMDASPAPAVTVTRKSTVRSHPSVVEPPPRRPKTTPPVMTTEKKEVAPPPATAKPPASAVIPSVTPDTADNLQGNY